MAIVKIYFIFKGMVQMFIASIFVKLKARNIERRIHLQTSETTLTFKIADNKKLEKKNSRYFATRRLKKQKV
jgi:hypothetical protein